jgi:hypothetical protein
MLLLRPLPPKRNTAKTRRRLSSLEQVLTVQKKNGNDASIVSGSTNGPKWL